jgi:hypothetical protein
LHEFAARTSPAKASPWHRLQSPFTCVNPEETTGAGTGFAVKKFKQTKLAKRLYRASNTTLGAPLKGLARLTQAEALQARHYVRANIRHNRSQVEILARFETEQSRTS